MVKLLAYIRRTVADNATGFEDESLIIVEADVHSMMKLAIFIGNVHYKDLLETNFSTGKLFYIIRVYRKFDREVQFWAILITI